MLHLLHLHSYIYSVAMAGAGDRPFLCWWQHRGPSARWQPALQILTRATVCGALSVSIGSILQSAHGAASTLVDSPVGQRSRPQRKSSSRDRMGRRLQVLSIDDAFCKPFTAGTAERGTVPGYKGEPGKKMPTGCRELMPTQRAYSGPPIRAT